MAVYVASLIAGTLFAGKVKLDHYAQEKYGVKEVAFEVMNNGKKEIFIIPNKPANLNEETEVKCITFDDNGNQIEKVKKIFIQGFKGKQGKEDGTIFKLDHGVFVTPIPSQAALYANGENLVVYFSEKKLDNNILIEDEVDPNGARHYGQQMDPHAVNPETLHYGNTKLNPENNPSTKSATRRLYADVYNTTGEKVKATVRYIYHPQQEKSDDKK